MIMRFSGQTLQDIRIHICAFFIMLVAAASVPAYTPDTLALPDVLKQNNGDTVTTSEQWERVRRPEILELFRTYVYGRIPVREATTGFKLFDDDTLALEGTAIRRQVSLITETGSGIHSFNMLLYLPQSAKQRPVPVLCLLNFGGNHVISTDTAVALPRAPVKPKNSPPASFRGIKADRYRVKHILERGYGIATAYYADIDPDKDDGFKNGIHPVLDGKEPRPDDAWGAVAAWAWGLSRMMDYLVTDRYVAGDKVMVLGHSRLGKTALWAGARDERFAMVVSNNSGCTGAALARRRSGETVKRINDTFPHWFCRNYRRYNDNEDALPVDQHMLVALIAPRPVYVASAVKDTWADPTGEFLACVHAGPVYRLYGYAGVGSDTLPAVDTPLQSGRIGYHIRTGRHKLLPYDVDRFMDFADRHLLKMDPAGKPE